MSEKIKTAVMEVIKAHMVGEDKNTKAVLSDVIESVNELEPLEQEPCETCGYAEGSPFCLQYCPYDAERKKEQEPCEDAVSREAVINTLDYADKALDTDRTIKEYKALLCECYKVLPSVTRQTGEWILLDECANSGYYCSKCQKKLVKEGWSETVKKIKYCPNCGAKMIEPQESEDNK